MSFARSTGLSGLALSLFLAVMAPAQTPAAGGTQPGSLSHEQQLQIEDYAKDVKLAAQQIELLKVQLAGAIVQERRSAASFNQYLGRLRTQLHAPAREWDFDLGTLQFVPKGSAAKTAAQVTRKAAKAVTSAPPKAGAPTGAAK